MSERGSMTVIGIAVIGLFMVVSTAIAGLGVTYSARARAATAADAAALAAAVATYPPLGRGTPEGEAARAAALNSAEVERCLCRVDPSLEDRSVTVVVSVPVVLPLLGAVRVTSSSSAEFSPMRWLGG
jgi:secretion/DNA translocation related TadE-like protein